MVTHVLLRRRLERLCRRSFLKFCREVEGQYSGVVVCTGRGGDLWVRLHYAVAVAVIGIHPGVYVAAIFILLEVGQVFAVAYRYAAVYTALLIQPHGVFVVFVFAAVNLEHSRQQRPDGRGRFYGKIAGGGHVRPKCKRVRRDGVCAKPRERCLHRGSRVRRNGYPGQVVADVIGVYRDEAVYGFAYAVYSKRLR